MVDCSDGVSRQLSEVNGQSLQFALNEQFDNRRELLARERAWEDLKLRKAQNAATLDHFINMFSAQSTAASSQTGQTENQQTVNPIRTGTADTLVGGEGVAAEQVAANVANMATAMTPILASALATAISETLAAVLPAVVAAAQQKNQNPTPAA